MQPSKENVRFFAETMRRNGISTTLAHQYLTNAWQEDAPSYDSVCRYYRDFATGRRITFVDADRSGRPTSSTTPAFVDQVRQLVEGDPHISVERIAEELQISHGSVHSILKDSLHMKFVTTRWLPHDLSDSQKTNRVSAAYKWLQVLEDIGDQARRHLVVIDEKWVYLRAIGTHLTNKCWLPQGEDPPRIPRRQMNDEKCLLLLAISFSGDHCFHLLNYSQTVDSQVFMDFLRQVHHNFVRHVQPLDWNETIFIMDNARPHISRKTQEFLKSHGATVLPQPPYSPDYNLCDRWTFLELEKRRRHRSFATKDELTAYLTDTLKSFSPTDLLHQFHHLKTDLNRIIHNAGAYL